MNIEELIRAAMESREKAWCPYSNFKVGCALQTSTGDLFSGCNVENSSYGLAICAERNAIASMINAGQREISQIVVVANPIATPCGACRQVIVEFGENANVFCVDAKETSAITRYSIAELIPDYFRFQK